MSATSPASEVRGAGTEIVVLVRSFPAALDQVAEARRFLAEVAGQEAWAKDAVLCLSELVSNSVVHSASARPGGLVQVRIKRSARELLAEVCDDGGPWRNGAGRGADGQSGRGLMIVEALASSFGITGDEHGRTARFTFELA